MMRPLDVAYRVAGLVRGALLSASSRHQSVFASVTLAISLCLFLTLWICFGCGLAGQGRSFRLRVCWQMCRRRRSLGYAVYRRHVPWATTLGVHRGYRAGWTLL